MFPSSVRSIIIVEFMERYAYYAFRSVLTTYFVVLLSFSESHAVSAFMYTSALAYFTPVIGGLLSDSVLGKYRTIVIFSGVYIVGLLALSVAAYGGGLRFWTFLGLGLIGVGTGGIKPCVSSFGADQIKYGDGGGDSETRDNVMRSYFSAFYFSINVGALLSYILSPMFKSNFGYGFCFLVPGLMMAGALGVLMKSKREYVIIMPGGKGNDDDKASSKPPSSPVALLCRIVSLSTYDKISNLLSPPSASFLSRSLKYPRVNDGNVRDAEDFFRTIKFAALMPAFWMLFDQQGSAWVLQAKRMSLPSWIQAEQLGVCNTAFVLVMLPVMEKYIYPSLERRGIRVTSLRRMGAGMVLAGVAFLISALVELTIRRSPPTSVSFINQVPQYLVLTIAEIGVSTTGLEFFYQEAPPNLKTASASLFLLTTAVGDVLGGVVYDVAEGLGMTNQANLLFFCGFLMFGVSGAFVKFSLSYEYRIDEEKGEGGEIEFSLVRSENNEEEEEEEGRGGLDLRTIDIDGA